MIICRGLNKYMTWSSKEIKQEGLNHLNHSFLLSYCMIFFLSLAADIPTFFTRSDASLNKLSMMSSVLLTILFLAFFCFLYLPLAAGKNRLFLESYEGESSIHALWYYFSHGRKTYLSIVKGMTLRCLSILAGALVFLIPGVMQYYRTFFTPWILVSHPELTTREAMQKSYDMCRNQKMSIFLLQLSFCGWILLCLFLSYRFSLLLPMLWGRIVFLAIYALVTTYYTSTVVVLYHRLQTT